MAASILAGACLVAAAAAGAQEAAQEPAPQAAQSAAQDDPPLWEAGVGAGAVSVPAYRGSRRQRAYAAPLPYFIYRGERLHANRDGIGLSVLGADGWKLDLSVAGDLPVQSSGTARAGMRDLPPALELGAALKYDLVQTPQAQGQLRLPLRYATGLHLNHLDGIGWISDPGLWVSGEAAALGPRWTWGASLFATFQTAAYDNYYYGVGAADATAARPVWSARGGYAGTDLRAGLAHRIGDVIVSGFLGVADLAGASFAASPLVDRRFNAYGGFAVLWVLDRSARPAYRGAPPDMP